MLTLVVDTATPSVQAAVVAVTDTGVEPRAARSVVDARGHGEHLTPLITAAMEAAKVTPHQLAAVVAGTGPGPFTGLRVGLVTAAALSHALGVPAYGVCSLDGIGAATDGRTLVATDARRREVYWAVYVNGDRREQPRVTRPGDLPESARAVDAAAGDGAMRYRDVLGLPVLETPRYPDPVVLAEQAADRVRAGAPGGPLTPLYLRRPDVSVPASAAP